MISGMPQEFDHLAAQACIDLLEDMGLDPMTAGVTAAGVLLALAPDTESAVVLVRVLGDIADHLVEVEA